MRKHEIYHVTTTNRDQGKKFRLTEMSAVAAEKWANQVLTTIQSELITEDIISGGMMSLSLVGIRPLYQIDIEEQMSLLNRLLECVEIEIEDGSYQPFNVETDVEEEVTLVLLRARVFELHIGSLYSRKSLDIGNSGGSGRDLRGYPNVPQSVGCVISAGFATLAELDTVYGVEDLYDLLEIAIIDAHNQREAMRDK